MNEFKRGVRFARAIQEVMSGALNRPACSRTAVHMSETTGRGAKCKMCGKRMEVESARGRACLENRSRLENGVWVGTTSFR